MNEDIMICRCEDINREQILKYIEMGFTSVEEIKRVSRAGMGNCQGRTCIPLIAQILKEELNAKAEDGPDVVKRPPLIPVSLELLGKSYEEHRDEK